MGNYRDLEYEFIERTMTLISQYHSDLFKYKFEERYNHTLLINCLLGVVVMPKERVLDAIPKSRLTVQLKKDIGLEHSEINSDISEFKDLMIQLRHAISHFSVKVESYNDQFLIDEIVFLNPEEDYVIARIKAEELLPFIRYYGSWVLSNIKSNQAFKKAVAVRRPNKTLKPKR